ncbi:MAG: DUF1499 domain-containing protein [Anaerolineae bacterium]|jgi:uncharacterized protein (DUF1499 family)|nr:DUF1499 domain-containing protein [Anaerolineae bacterium]
MTKLQRILIVLGGIIAALFIIIRLVVSSLMQPPPTLGVEDGRLVDCPSYPACVSSYADPADEAHYVSGIANDKPIDEAITLIKYSMASISGAVLVAEEENYLHYEIKVPPFGFVDDVEFYLPENLTIELRSSARVPYYDFDVNRNRVEMLRELITSNQKEFIN